MGKICVDKFKYRCRDMNPTCYDITKEEELAYYKFFNEWNNRKVVWVGEVKCEISRHAYEGVVVLKPLKT